MVDNAPKILIVDDDPLLRQLLIKVFSDVGFETATAADGVDAIEVYRRFGPDVVLMDIIMPEREGVEATIELRAMDAAIPIIAMSAGGRVGPTEFLSLAASLGATMTIRKPFTIRQIREAVRRVLDKPEDRASSRAEDQALRA